MVRRFLDSLRAWSGGAWPLLIVGAILAILYAGGWYGLQLVSISKEYELETHMADLGQALGLALHEPVLELADLAWDASLSSQTGASAGAPTPDPAQYRAGLDTRLTKPFREAMARTRLARLTVLNDAGVVLYDSNSTVTLLKPFTYRDIDQHEIGQALQGAAVSTPAYTTGQRDRHIRTYVPVKDSSGGVGALICLAAGRDYLAEIDRLERHLIPPAAVVTGLLMLVVGMFIHSTARQRRIERRAARADRLASLGALAAGFAHELRNPLEIIRAFTEDLERSLNDGVDRDEALQACRAIVEEIDRMNRLVGQFLSFSRADQSDAVQRAPVLDGLQAVLAMVRPMADRQGITFEAQVTDEIADGEDGTTVGLEPGRFKQVLMNLVLNAVQASPEGGRVTVAVRAPAHWVEVQVSDQGPGVAPQNAPRIFEPFFTTRPAGSGLGLTVSRQIALAVGGELDLAGGGAGRHGACFVLRLPRAPERVETPRHNVA